MEEEGRRGVLFLLSSPHEEEEEEADLREHIASDITQFVGWTSLIELKFIARKEKKRRSSFSINILSSVTGAGKYLKMKNPSIKVICVEPAESPVISGGELGRHKIQGLGPGFVPQNLEKSQIDEIVMVTSEESMTNARRLAREEGLLVGISSGANLAACLKVVAREENKGKMIVTMFPSGGERYVSSELFALAREECTKMTF